jgi:hypothetical protein
LNAAAIAAARISSFSFLPFYLELFCAGKIDSSSFAARILLLSKAKNLIEKIKLDVVVVKNQWSKYEIRFDINSLTPIIKKSTLKFEPRCCS